MFKKGKILGFFVTLVLIFIFTPAFFYLYEKIIGHKLSGGFGVLSGRSYFEGFFMSYAFFVSVFASLFLDKKKYIFLAVSLGLVCLLHLVFQVWESLIIFIITAAAALFLVEVVLLAKRKIIDKK